jgi:CDP-glucose 4,6-dehydratase
VGHQSRTMENLVTMFDELKQTYGGKRVFLTGHTGFKGAWLLKILHLLGANVKGYALAPKSAEDLYYTIKGDNLCQSVIADLRDRERLTTELVNYKPDFIFHLAAQPLVRLSYEIPSETFEVNVIGTANVLDGLRLLDNKCSAIMITTDKVYHNYEWVHPYRENDRLGGYDPYSASKACAELVIDSYKNSFFNIKDYSEHKKAVAICRAGNVIGGGDWNKDRLLPDIARALGNNSKIIVRNPAAVRPWQHVLEPLKGYLLLAGKLAQNPLKYASAYNFGPNNDDALSVEEMVKLSISEWGQGEYEASGKSANLHEAGLLKLDISKATGEIGYKPLTNASDAIKLTIEWYKNYFINKISSDAFTERQIEYFFNIKN